MIAANDVADRAYTSAAPGPVVSAARRGDRAGPVEASEDAVVCNILEPTVVSDGVHTSFLMMAN